MAESDILHNTLAQIISGTAAFSAGPQGKRTYACTKDDPEGTGRTVKDWLRYRQQELDDAYSGRTHLPPSQTLWLRQEIDRLSLLENPNARNAWGPYTPAEQAYLQEQEAERRRFANNIGMMAGGPVLSAAPMIARVANAPENVVEDLGEINVNIALSVEGVLSGRQANRGVSRSGTTRPGELEPISRPPQSSQQPSATTPAPTSPNGKVAVVRVDGKVTSVTPLSGGGDGVVIGKRPKYSHTLNNLPKDWMSNPKLVNIEPTQANVDGLAKKLATDAKSRGAETGMAAAYIDNRGNVTIGYSKNAAKSIGYQQEITPEVRALINKNNENPATRGFGGTCAEPRIYSSIGTTPSGGYMGAAQIHDPVATVRDACPNCAQLNKNFGVGYRDSSDGEVKPKH